MEIQFLHEAFTEKDPKLLIDHIQRMVSLFLAPVSSSMRGCYYSAVD